MKPFFILALGMIPTLAMGAETAVSLFSGDYEVSDQCISQAKTGANPNETFSTGVQVETDAQQMDRIDLAKLHEQTEPYLKTPGKRIRFTQTVHRTGIQAVQVPTTYAMDATGKLAIVHSDDCKTDFTAPIETAKYRIYRLGCDGLPGSSQIDSTLVMDKESGKFVYVDIRHKESGRKIGSLKASKPHSSDQTCRAADFDLSILTSN